MKCFTFHFWWSSSWALEHQQPRDGGTAGCHRFHCELGRGSSNHCYKAAFKLVFSEHVKCRFWQLSTWVLQSSVVAVCQHQQQQ